MDPSNDGVVNIKFTKSSHFKTIPATGVWGGATPQGEVLCNFFIEFQEHPENIRLHINKLTGKIEESVNITPKKFIRESQVSIIMRPDIARTIGEWMIKEADKMIFNAPTAAPKN